MCYSPPFPASSHHLWESWILLSLLNPVPAMSICIDSRRDEQIYNQMGLYSNLFLLGNISSRGLQSRNHVFVQSQDSAHGVAKTGEQKQQHICQGERVRNQRISIVIINSNRVGYLEQQIISTNYHLVTANLSGPI